MKLVIGEREDHPFDKAVDNPTGYVEYENRRIAVPELVRDYCIQCGSEENVEVHLYMWGDPNFWRFSLCKECTEKFLGEDHITDNRKVDPSYEVRSLDGLTMEEIEDLDRQ